MVEVFFLDVVTQYLESSEPSNSEHLWRYTPWKRVHPSGDVTEVPELGKPSLNLFSMDGNEVPDGIRLIEGEVRQRDQPDSYELTNAFLLASSECSKWTLEVDKKLSYEFTAHKEDFLLQIYILMGEV